MSLTAEVGVGVKHVEPDSFEPLGQRANGLCGRRIGDGIRSDEDRLGRVRRQPPAAERSILQTRRRRDGHRPLGRAAGLRMHDFTGKALIEKGGRTHPQRRGQEDDRRRRRQRRAAARAASEARGNRRLDVEALRGLITISGVIRLACSEKPARSARSQIRLIKRGMPPESLYTCSSAFVVNPTAADPPAIVSRCATYAATVS